MGKYKYSRILQRCFLFVIMVFALCVVSQASFAESFKSSDFLKWKRENQDYYIGLSIGMASLIAGRNNKAQGHCLDDWYYSDEVAKNKFILDTMKRVPNYHPRGVILAVLEKQCGKLIYLEN